MKPISISLLIITIFIVSLACNLPSVGVNQTPTPLPQTVVDPQQILNQAVKVDSSAGTITITLTETQLNGLILVELQKLQSSLQVSVNNPVVKLQNGLITLSGQLSSGPINSDFSLSIKPVVTADHKLSFEMADSNFGGLPVPQEIIKQLIAKFNTAVNQSINSSGENILIDSITISDGKMVILAHR